MKKQFKRITELTINRKKWARKTDGVEKGTSRLLNEQGNMCCLGFVCKAAGLKANQIDNQAEPEVLGVKIPVLTKLSDNGCFYNTEFSNQAISINDSMFTTDAVKESLLRRLFSKNHIKLKFVG